LPTGAIDIGKQDEVLHLYISDGTEIQYAALLRRFMAFKIENQSKPVVGLHADYFRLIVISLKR
jgi:hypothetical protein